MLKVEEAAKELEEKSYDQIQVETAWKWGSRAAACFKRSLEENNTQEAFYALFLGIEYLHEAVEHAALAEDTSLLQAVKDAVVPLHEQALEALGL